MIKHRHTVRDWGAVFLSVGSAFVFLAGCPQSPTNEGGGASATDEGMAAALFQRITQEDPYTEWSQFPGATGIVPSGAPHGEQADIRINGVVASAFDNFEGALPADSIIVKRNIGGDSGKADALTVMWKIDGFAPDNNDWFWANIALDGQVNAAGKIAGCIACHGGVRENDFIFTHSF